MKLYRVSLIVGQTDMLRFLDRNAGTDVKVEALPEEPAEARGPMGVSDGPSALYTPQRGPRRQRTSKVAAAIMASLEAGRGWPSDLKKALEDAGLSATSLPQSLALLKKAGTIGQHSSGAYFATTTAPQEPAEAAQ